MNTIILAIQFALPCLAMGSPTKRIINGEVIERGQWPFLVSLHFLRPFEFTNHSKMQHVCGGSLIAPTWVLTAAHCVSELVEEGLTNVSNWKVVLGEHNQYLREEEEQILDIQEIIRHPLFNPPVTGNLLNDIALLRLATPANITDFVNTTDLNFEQIPVGTKCEVAGWGQISEDSKGWGMYVPLETNLTIVSTTSCSQAYGGIPVIQVDHSIVCATYPVNEELPPEMNSNDHCSGDSGGPLICETGPGLMKKKKLVGVVSAGLCGSRTHPGMYANVSYYRTWIEENMGGTQTLQLQY